MYECFGMTFSSYFQMRMFCYQGLSVTNINCLVELIQSMVDEEKCVSTDKGCTHFYLSLCSAQVYSYR